MNIILLGAPASGKGTMSNFLKQTYDIPVISTGDIIRENIKNKTMAHIQPDLKSAVIYANSITHDGIILLSPACASFDEFSGFEQRGTYFKQIVASLKNNESVKGVV